MRMADTKAILDRLVVQQDDPNKLLWWWCDALFMSPPVLLRMYEITHDQKYLDYMDHEWWLTSGSLYNKEDHLYFRDSHYFTQKQSNGKGLLVARQWLGDGWAGEGAADDAEDYPSRPKYVAQFKEMAEEIASIQSADGLWRTGLLDPDAYDLPEVSGSAFFTFGIAYGINEHILDRSDLSACRGEVVEGDAWRMCMRTEDWDLFSRLMRSRGSSSHRPAMSMAWEGFFWRGRRCTVLPSTRFLL